jgi:Protein of unknown function (DUF2851)
MVNLYPRLLSPESSSKKSKLQNNEVTERHLQALWLEQKFFKHLKTAQGLPIQVLSAGLWNREAGPDFLKAHLKIGSEFYRGDIEIHFKDEGWVTHQHHLDPRYNQVILHVSYWNSIKPRLIQKENGAYVTTCYLSDALTITYHQIIEYLDLDLYPYQRSSQRGKCASLFSMLSSKETTQLFRSAAYWRLERKLDWLNESLSQFPYRLLSGIARGLGYKHNAEAFFDLLPVLWKYRDESSQTLLAIALGCTGFLEEGHRREWEASPYYQDLRLLWWGKRDEIIHQSVLRLDHIRPLNHPIRRLAELTRLIQQPLIEQLEDKLWTTWQETKEINCLSEKLIHLITLEPDLYWTFHYFFETTPQLKPLPGLGEEINKQILLNTYLPLIYEKIRQTGELEQWDRLHALYDSLKITETSKSRYLTERFFINPEKKNFFRQAQMGQGAYQIHHDFCIHYETSCEGCPFITRYHLTR